MTEPEYRWTSYDFLEQKRSFQMPADATAVSMLIFLVIGLIMGIKMGRRRSQ